MKTVTFIGPGVMAEAMLSALIRQDLVSGERIRVSGPRAERVNDLAARYGVQPFTDNRQACAEADVVVLAVKPQQLDQVLHDLRGALSSGAMALSIVAGAPIAKIRTGLGHDSIVRAMPNTPARIGHGVTVWTASSHTDLAQLDTAARLLEAMGSAIFVEEEKYLDMATALSGTGPAYVFLFMEALIDAGVHLGFPRRIAEQLVVETVLGAAEYYRQQGETHVAALRNQVTSPGGTSAEALYYLEKAGFRPAISRAVWAAYQRSLELGQKNEPHIPSDAT